MPPDALPPAAFLLAASAASLPPLAALHYPAVVRTLSHTYMHTHMLTHAHTHIHTNTYTYTYTYTHAHTHTYTHTNSTCGAQAEEQVVMLLEVARQSDVQILLSRFNMVHTARMLFVLLEEGGDEVRQRLGHGPLCMVLLTAG